MKKQTGVGRNENGIRRHEKKGLGAMLNKFLKSETEKKKNGWIWSNEKKRNSDEFENTDNQSLTREKDNL